MTEEQWITIPGWEHLQHYKDRSPAWIKLYVDLNSRDDWLRLSDTLRGKLVTLWCEYARSNGVLSTRSLHKLSTGPTRIAHLEALQQAGFITLSASKPLALRYQRARAEKSREEKSNREASQAKPAQTAAAPSANKTGQPWIPNLHSYTGARLVHGSHGTSYTYDPLGTARPPADWPHPTPTPAEIAKALAQAK